VHLLLSALARHQVRIGATQVLVASRGASGCPDAPAHFSRKTLGVRSGEWPWRARAKPPGRRLSTCSRPSRGCARDARGRNALHVLGSWGLGKSSPRGPAHSPHGATRSVRHRPTYPRICPRPVPISWAVTPGKDGSVGCRLRSDEVRRGLDFLGRLVGVLDVPVPGHGETSRWPGRKASESRCASHAMLRRYACRSQSQMCWTPTATLWSEGGSYIRTLRETFYPFVTPIGTSFATLSEMPASCMTWTTFSTSL